MNTITKFKVSENYVSNFISWLRKHIKVGLIITILSSFVGAIGVIHQIYFTPNISEEINKTIVASIKEYEALNPVILPDSILNYKEVKLLKKYQDEFEIYKLHLASLDYTEVKDDNDTIKMSIWYGRYMASGEYHKQSQYMNKIIQEILEYENKYELITHFGNTLDINGLYKLLHYQETVANESKKNQDDIYKLLKTPMYEKTMKEKNRLYDMFEYGYSNENMLSLIKLETSFYKSFYIATSIRLRRILAQSN